MFSAHGSGGEYRLYRRWFDEDDAAAIGGTEGATEPVFSPDGQWLAFIQKGRLLRMPAGGGAPIELVEVTGPQGGSFVPDGSIIYNGQHGEGLWRVAAGNAKPSPVTTVEVSSGEAGHHWPHVLPGGTHLLYTVELDGKSYWRRRLRLLHSTAATGVC